MPEEGSPAFGVATVNASYLQIPSGPQTPLPLTTIACAQFHGQFTFLDSHIGCLSKMRACYFAPNICSLLPELWAVVRSNSQLSVTSHFNRSVERIFEVVSVIGRNLVSIAEVHAIVAEAKLAQSEPEMARDRFGFPERHEYSKEMPQGHLWRGSCSVSSADCCEV